MTETPIASLVVRERATAAGVVQSVLLRPRSGVPAVEAELVDDTGLLRLVWLGRRHIAGITPGRRLRVQGMVTTMGSDQHPAMFNPRYELIAKAGQ